MYSSITANITLAILLSDILLLTSKSFLPRPLHVGIPIGHPYSTVLISSPMIFRSSLARDNSHSLTGLFPLLVS
ncbi:hypothetical protein SHALO_0079 [Sulfurospirillum halorespirans DSM 13726]|uniref:Uncharacterized protein n=1 Tax=Sulfurospirillum halorespirans DSM 13726 TaxID=1193502 RepID=A0A1D7TFV7_9BACT|nr:hypothetical protein SHALO_0079 [Sulfurospirillum halorespirans DSM 13726]